MVDLESEAGLITVQMYDALGWLVELLIRIKADAIILLQGNWTFCQ